MTSPAESALNSGQPAVQESSDQKGSSESSTADCPYWRRGYCVADNACKLRHDTSQGGQLQESYLTQLKQTSKSAQYMRPPPVPMGGAPGYYGVPMNASAMASAVYGGQQPSMMYAPAYGYYGIPIGAPMQSGGAPKNYKTVQCRHFLRGHCMRGSACGFRHEGADEGTPNDFGSIPVELSNPLHPGRPFRTVTCRRWLSGHCGVGDRCTYKHDYDPSMPHQQFDPYMQGQPYPALGAFKRSLSPEKATDDNSNESFKLQKTVQ